MIKKYITIKCKNRLEIDIPLSVIAEKMGEGIDFLLKEPNMVIEKLVNNFKLTDFEGFILVRPWTIPLNSGIELSFDIEWYDKNNFSFTEYKTSKI